MRCKSTVSDSRWALGTAAECCVRTSIQRVVRFRRSQFLCTAVVCSQQPQVLGSLKHHSLPYHFSNTLMVKPRSALVFHLPSMLSLTVSGSPTVPRSLSTRTGFGWTCRVQHQAPADRSTIKAAADLHFRSHCFSLSAFLFASCQPAKSSHSSLNKVAVCNKPPGSQWVSGLFQGSTCSYTSYMVAKQSLCDHCHRQTRRLECSVRQKQWGSSCYEQSGLTTQALAPALALDPQRQACDTHNLMSVICCDTALNMSCAGVTDEHA